MFMEVIASSLSVGCLGCGGFGVWHGLGPGREDEAQPILFLASFLMLPLAYLFGIHASAESWVLSGGIALTGGFLWTLRSMLKRNW